MPVFEADNPIGGPSHTVGASGAPVDTGFTVYNKATYPNLTALFAHRDVPTKTLDMSFAASMGGGQLEYAGTNLGGLFAHSSNLASPRFWSMLRDLVRAYRQAVSGVRNLDPSASLNDYLDSVFTGEP